MIVIIKVSAFASRNFLVVFNYTKIRQLVTALTAARQELDLSTSVGLSYRDCISRPSSETCAETNVMLRNDSAVHLTVVQHILDSSYPSEIRGTH